MFKKRLLTLMIIIISILFYSFLNRYEYKILTVGNNDMQVIIRIDRFLNVFPGRGYSYDKCIFAAPFELRELPSLYLGMDLCDE